MSNWIKKGAEEAYWEACRTEAEGAYFVEGCWAWTADQEPSENMSFKVAPSVRQTEAEIIAALNEKYINWCATRGFSPRASYAFEGFTDTLLGRAMDLRA